MITVRQQLIWEMLGEIDQPNSQGVMSQPLCVELQTSGNDAAASRMLQLLEMMSAENNPRQPATRPGPAGPAAAGTDRYLPAGGSGPATTEHPEGRCPGISPLQ